MYNIWASISHSRLRVLTNSIDSKRAAYLYNIYIYTHTHNNYTIYYIYIHSKSVLHTIYSRYLTTTLISVFRIYLYKHIIGILYMRGGS